MTMLRRALLLVLCAVGLPAGLALAGNVAALARVDSSRFWVGDWIHVRVQVIHPKGTEFQSVVGDSVDGFHVLQHPPLALQTDSTSGADFILARYDSGTVAIPPLSFLYHLPGDSTTRTVATLPLMVTVRTVDVDTSKEIADLKPPMSIPMSAGEIAMIAGIVLVLVLLVYGGYRLWLRRKRALEGIVEAPPLRPAHVIAYEELEALKAKHLWQQGFVKEYYSEATDILRRYFHHRYAMTALEETTDEIMESLRKLRFTSDLTGKIEGILRRADLVKFAKYQPVPGEHDEMIIVVQNVVDKTKIVEMIPTEAEAAKETHAGH